MTIALNSSPGRTVTLAVQVVDGYGARADGYQSPSVEFVRLPNGANAAGFPVAMTRIDLGLYIHSITLPTGSTAIGTYLAQIVWPHPESGIFQSELYLINVQTSGGSNSSVSPA
jgi:hypothetical protein